VSRLSRFSSPDPIAGSTSDPQSLNRYSYVRNMPVVFMDPAGTCPPTVQNLQPDASERGDYTGDPSASGYEMAGPDPQGNSQPCAGTFWNPWTTWGTWGGGAGGLDGGYNGDDSGFGIGSPIGVSPGDSFSGTTAALTPTYTFTGSANFHWQDYDLDDLLDFVDQNEITLTDVSFQWS